MIWDRLQVVRPRWGVVLPLVLVGVLAGCVWLRPQADCTIFLRYDGGATARPYYAVRQCDGKPPVVLCDSPTPLPTPTCPTPTGAQ